MGLCLLIVAQDNQSFAVRGKLRQSEMDVARLISDFDHFDSEFFWRADVAGVFPVHEEKVHASGLRPPSHQYPMRAVGIESRQMHNGRREEQRSRLAVDHQADGKTPRQLHAFARVIDLLLRRIVGRNEEQHPLAIRGKGERPNQLIERQRNGRSAGGWDGRSIDFLAVGHHEDLLARARRVRVARTVRAECDVFERRHFPRPSLEGAVEFAQRHL